MEFPEDYKRVIAILEKSSGGETPEMWLETQSFNRDIPVNVIISWAWKKRMTVKENKTGRLILAIDENVEELIPQPVIIEAEEINPLNQQNLNYPPPPIDPQQAIEMHKKAEEFYK